MIRNTKQLRISIPALHCQHGQLESTPTSCSATPFYVREGPANVNAPPTIQEAPPARDSTRNTGRS